MATNTYIPLATYTVTGSNLDGPTGVTFNLPTGYRDIVIKCKLSSTNNAIIVGQFNGDTSGNYSTTSLGNGPATTRSSNSTGFYFSSYAHSTTNWNTHTYHIMNYSNSTHRKTVLMRGDNSNYGVEIVAGTWNKSSLEPVTSVRIFLDRTENIVVGSTFTVYGIGGVGGELAPKALGGEVFTDADYYYHLYRGAGTFQPLQSLTADILVVAGGGGAIGAGGGGGAGGLLGFASQSLTAQAYPVFVGAGGVKGSPGSGAPTNGSNSKFGALTTAVGGAGGGGYNAPSGVYQAALSGGGSGGGGAYYSGVNYSTGISGQGNSGSNGRQGTGGGEPRSGGGGGGAGGAAASGSDNVGGNGGIGATYNSTVGGSAGPYAFINAMGAATGTGELYSGNYYYAGGGGGEGKNSRGAAGIGGGGRGGTSEPAQYPDAGTAHTGGGAGAGPNSSSSYGGANGGSGVVIVRYAK